MINATDLRTHSKWLAVDAREPGDLGMTEARLEAIRRDFILALTTEKPKELAEELKKLHNAVKADLHRGHTVQGESLTPKDIDKLSVLVQEPNQAEPIEKPVHPFLLEFIKHQYYQNISNSLIRSPFNYFESTLGISPSPTYSMECNVELVNENTLLIYSSISRGRVEELEADTSLRSLRAIKSVIRVSINPDNLNGFVPGTTLNLLNLPKECLDSLEQALKVEFVSCEHFHDAEFLSESEKARLMDRIATKILAGDPLLVIEEAQIERLLFNKPIMKLTPVERAILANQSLERAKGRRLGNEEEGYRYVNPLLSSSGIRQILQDRNLHQWVPYFAQKYHYDTELAETLKMHQNVLDEVLAAVSESKIQKIATLMRKSPNTVVSILSSLDEDTLSRVLNSRTKGRRSLMDEFKPDQAFELCKLNPTATVEFLRHRSSRFSKPFFTGKQLRTLIQCHPTLKQNPEFALPRAATPFGRFKDWARRFLVRNYRDEARRAGENFEIPVKPTLATLNVAKARLDSAEGIITELENSLQEQIGRKSAANPTADSKPYFEKASKSAMKAVLSDHSQLVQATEALKKPSNDVTAAMAKVLDPSIKAEDDQHRFRQDAQEKISTAQQHFTEIAKQAEQANQRAQLEFFVPAAILRPVSPELAFVPHMTDTYFDYLCTQDLTQLAFGFLFNRKIQEAFKALPIAKQDEMLGKLSVAVELDPDRPAAQQQVFPAVWRDWLFESAFIKGCIAKFGDEAAKYRSDPSNHAEALKANVRHAHAEAVDATVKQTWDLIFTLDSQTQFLALSESEQKATLKNLLEAPTPPSLREVFYASEFVQKRLDKFSNDIDFCRKIHKVAIRQVPLEPQQLRVLKEGSFEVVVQDLISSQNTLELLKTLMAKPDLQAHLMKTGRYFPILDQMFKSVLAGHTPIAEVHAWFLYVATTYRESSEHATAFEMLLEQLLNHPQLRAELNVNMVEILQSVFENAGNDRGNILPVLIQFLAKYVDQENLNQWVHHLESLSLEQLKTLGDKYPSVGKQKLYRDVVWKKCEAQLAEVSFDGKTNTDLKYCFDRIETYFEEFKANLYLSSLNPMKIILKQLSDSTLIQVLEDCVLDTFPDNNKTLIREALLNKLITDTYWRSIVINAGKAGAIQALLEADPNPSHDRVELLRTKLHDETFVDGSHEGDRVALIGGQPLPVQAVRAIDYGEINLALSALLRGEPGEHTLARQALCEPTLELFHHLDPINLDHILLMQPPMPHWHAWLADHSVMKILLTNPNSNLQPLSRNKVSAENFLRFAYSDQKTRLKVSNRTALEFLNDIQNIAFTREVFKQAKEPITLMVASKLNADILAPLSKLPEFIESILRNARAVAESPLNCRELFNNLMMQHPLLRQKAFEYVNRQYEDHPKDHALSSLLLDDLQILHELIKTDGILNAQNITLGMRERLAIKIGKTLPEILNLPGVTLEHVFAFMIPLLGTARAFTDFLSKVNTMSAGNLRDSANALLTSFDKQHTIVFIDFCLAHDIPLALNPSKANQRKDDFEPRLRLNLILKRPDYFNFNNKVDIQYLKATLKQMTYRKGFALALGLLNSPNPTVESLASKYINNLLKRFEPSRWKRNVLAETLLDEIFVDSPVQFFKMLHERHRGRVDVVLKRSNPAHLMLLARQLFDQHDDPALSDLFANNEFKTKVNLATVTDLVQLIGEEKELYRRVLELRPRLVEELIDTLDTKALLDFSSQHPACLVEILLEARGQKGLRTTATLHKKLFTKASVTNLASLEQLISSRPAPSASTLKWFRARVFEVFRSSPCDNGWLTQSGLMKQVFQHGFHVGSQSKEGNTDRLDMLPESHKKFLVDYFIHQSPAADKTADQIRWVNANSSAVQKLYLSDPIDISALAKQLTAHPAQLSSLQPLLSRHGVMKQLLESQDGNRVIWEVLVQFGQHTYQANALKPIFDQPEFWEQLGLDAHADQRKLILDIFGSHGIWGHPEHELTLKQTGLNIDANIYAQLCRLLAHQEPAEAEKFLKANEAFKNASAILAEINPVLDQMTDAEKAKLYKFASKQKMKGLFDHMEEYHQEKCQAPLNCIDILVLLQEVPANDPARMERILNNPDVQSKLFKFEGFEMSNENHVTSLVLVAELPHFKPWLVKNSLLTRGFIDRLKSEPTLHDKSVIAKLVQDVDKSTGTRAANVEGLTLWAPSRNSRTSATFVQIEEVGKPVEEAGKPEARPDNVVSPMVVIGY